MSDYFGAVPRLDYIDLWITQPNLESNQGFSSQLYHLDKPEQTYVTVFLNVFEVWPENGPLTYLPGEITAGVRRATGYERLYYVGNGRLSDDVLHTLVDESELICLTGPAGAGGIVDTSACPPQWKPLHERQPRRPGRQLYPRPQGPVAYEPRASPPGGGRPTSTSAA